MLGERGILRVNQIAGLVRPDNAHFPRTRLLWIENTHNRGGGSIQPYDNTAELCRWAHENGLRTHLDGARLWNAVAATGIEASKWAAHFDTVSVCFSKGLGAPAGSALAGSKDLISQAHRHRKVFGGGMRQAGIIAAGALYALEHHRKRLVEDHENARRMAEGLAAIPGASLPLGPPETNIVFFDLTPALGTADQLASRLDEQGVRILATGPNRLRAVTNLGVDADGIETALTQASDCLKQGSR